MWAVGICLSLSYPSRLGLGGMAAGAMTHCSLHGQNALNLVFQRGGAEVNQGGEPLNRENVTPPCRISH